MTERDIFLAVLDLPDLTARATYLDAACGGDVARRARVEALLQSHENAGSFLAAPAVASPEAGPANTQAFDATSSPGVDTDDEALGFLTPSQRPESLGRIGHYEVLEVLGKGGFGIVFRAFDDVLQRVVAVKVLAPAMAATSPARKRFLREARSSAQIRHENVVQVHAVEEQPLPYLVMEFIPGETLQDRLNRNGPLDVPEVLRIGRQIAEGLAAAHAQGLIHRDIKPANVLVEVGARQRVKLTDFGLARAADDASISQSGIVAGTPMYMAPEQAKGETLDHRADLFSLGSVLYVMCSGHPPFRASGTLAVLKRVCEEDPRPIREVIPEVPEWLCRIVEKLHAKNPAGRFQSAREVADVLADCESQWKARGAVKDVARIPAGKPRRRRYGPWAVAAALVFLALGLAAATALHFLPEQPPPLATRPTATDWGEVVDPLGDCRFAEAAGRLSITAPGDGNHNLNPTPGFNLGARRVLRDVEGDFEANVMVLPFVLPPSSVSTGPSKPYVGAGLVVWQDNTHFLRLFRSWMPSAGAYVHPEWYAGDATGQPVTSPVPDQPTHLRIRRTGGSLQLAASLDGQRWTELTTAKNLPLAARVRVGVAVVNSIDQEFTARFQGFSVQPIPSAAPPPPVVAPFDALKAKEYQEAWAKHLGVPVNLTNSIGMKLRLVPRGEFTMGTDQDQIAKLTKDIREAIGGDDWEDAIKREGPAHRVRLTKPYYFGVHEVTVAQFRQFVDATGFKTECERSGKGGMVPTGTGEDKPDPKASWRAPFKLIPAAENDPVLQVSWNDAQEFCRWLSQKEGRGYRLPTEAEWEFASRAGNTGRFSFGDDHFAQAQNAVFNQEAPNFVGSKKANQFGLFDMEGNAWEWCADWYGEYATVAATDPQGPTAGTTRVIRGGDFLHEWWVSRPGVRVALAPNESHYGNGFRVAIVGDLTPKSVPAGNPNTRP